LVPFGYIVPLGGHLSAIGINAGYTSATVAR
jgi:hypothetical protein